jgi:serine/threonine-protein kinase
LVRRQWLTPFQANQLLLGKGEELVIGPYRLLERLGEGAMGRVFKARHTRMERVVALKVINEERLTSSTAVERFQREVKAVAQLHHPNIVMAYDYGHDHGRQYYAMEYVTGRNLAQLVTERGPLPIRDACEYVRQTALGLQHAHERGLVHRDIKPHNLMVIEVSRGGANGENTHAAESTTHHSPLTTHHSPLTTHQIKILDFGLARFASETPSAGHLTQLGRIVGTVDYISPEQAGDPRTADIRSDIYSLGCCLYYLLTGRPPFEGADAVARIAARALSDAPLLRSVRPDAPQALEQVLANMLQRDPKRRYSTPAEVAAALDHIIKTRPQQALLAVAVSPAVNVPRPSSWQSHRRLLRSSRMPSRM